MSKRKRITDAEIVAAALAWVRVALRRGRTEAEHNAEVRLWYLALRAYEQRRGRGASSKGGGR